MERKTKRATRKARVAAIRANGDLKVEQYAIDLLRPHPQNYRSHPDDQLEHIKASIRANGFYRNVVAANDGTILAGHGVVEAARQLRIKTVPVIKLDVDRDSPDALKILTGDNEIARLGVIDDRALTEILKAVHESPQGLEGTGFDEKMLAALTMVTRPSSEIRDFNAAAEWLGMPDWSPEPKHPFVIVHFDNEADKQQFAKLVGEEFTENTKSIWWPKKPKDDQSSIRFKDADAPPRPQVAVKPSQK